MLKTKEEKNLNEMNNHLTDVWNTETNTKCCVSIWFYFCPLFDQENKTKETKKKKSVLNFKINAYGWNEAWKHRYEQHL